MTALSHTYSPLEQVRKSDQLAVEGSARQLSPQEQATVKRLLKDEKYDFVVNDIFEARSAEKQVFDDAPEINKPDTSWYHPLMENLGDTRARQQPGAALLTAEQEKALFLQYNYCRFRVCQIRDRIAGKKIKSADARDLLHWLDRAEGYRDQIAQTNLALVLAMAKRTRMNELDFSDLVSEGNMALLRAIDKFDVARGFKFSTYACRAILKAFSRLGVKTSKYRAMFPTDFDPKLERSNWSEVKRDLVEEDCVDEVRSILTENRADLSEIEMEVIEHRFGLSEQAAQEPKALTLEQVGRIIGVTKERVRQIQNKALDKIRHTLEDEYLS